MEAIVSHLLELVSIPSLLLRAYRGRAEEEEEEMKNKEDREQLGRGLGRGVGKKLTPGLPHSQDGNKQTPPKSFESREQKPAEVVPCVLNLGHSHQTLGLRASTQGIWKLFVSACQSQCAAWAKGIGEDGRQGSDPEESSLGQRRETSPQGWKGVCRS